MDGLPKLKLLMIRCPRLSTRSSIVTSVVEQAVLELTKSQSTVPSGMGYPQWVYANWVTAKVNEFLEPPFGGAHMTPTDWDNLHSLREAYCCEIVDWVDEIVRLNADAFQTEEDFKVLQVRVVRRFPNLWIIELRG